MWRVGSRKPGAEESPGPTRERHRAGLEQAAAALERARLGQESALIAEDLRLAATALGRITGRVDVEDLLDVIFSEFCIGKLNGVFHVKHTCRVGNPLAIAVVPGFVPGTRTIPGLDPLCWGAWGCLRSFSEHLPSCQPALDLELLHAYIPRHEFGQDL